MVSQDCVDDGSFGHKLQEDEDLVFLARICVPTAKNWSWYMGLHKYVESSKLRVLAPAECWASALCFCLHRFDSFENGL